MELVEPGYAMVDESWLTGLGRSLPYQAKWYDKVYPGVLDVMVIVSLGIPVEPDWCGVRQ